MIDGYLNQKVRLSRFVEDDETYGRPVYTDPVEIDARVERRRRKVRNKHGELVTSESTLYVNTVVNIDDKITFDDACESVVIAVTDDQDLAGEISHYEVYV